MSRGLTVSEIQEAQQICLDKGIPFFSYRLPGCESLCFGAQVSGDVAEAPDVAAFLGESGFLLSPFCVTELSPIRFIKKDIDLSSPEDWDILKAMPSNSVSEPVPVGAPDREEYLQQAEQVISWLKSGKVRKIVLSRVKAHSCKPYESVTVWFSELCKTYTGSFVFLVSIPGETLWMGASPETLLSCSDSGICTMSLAGTKGRDDFSEWTEKEREEQQIVTEYIESCFLNVSRVRPEISGPESRLAGNVKHLCTTFALDKESASKIDMPRLIAALHPTPAVGGFPLKEALSSIREIEKHNRRYYAGYLGPVYGNGQFDLFVNLRSMELFSDRVELYVGGGLTALSDADEEWNETEIKSRTLLDLIAPFNENRL